MSNHQPLPPSKLLQQYIILHFTVRGAIFTLVYLSDGTQNIFIPNPSQNFDGHV